MVDTPSTVDIADDVDDAEAARKAKEAKSLNDRMAELIPPCLGDLLG